MAKVIGQKCEDCGVGDYVQNPKTGKTFCSSKCWLTNPKPVVAQATAPLTSPAYERSNEKILENGAIRNSDWMYAKRIAVALTMTYFEKGTIIPSQVEEHIQVWAEKIYNMKPSA